MEAPQQAQPDYKGKWYPPSWITPRTRARGRLADSNPNTPRRDPDDVRGQHRRRALEIWTMSKGIVIDNVLVAANDVAAKELETSQWSPHAFMTEVAREAAEAEAEARKVDTVGSPRASPRSPTRCTSPTPFPRAPPRGWGGSSIPSPTPPPRSSPSSRSSSPFSSSACPPFSEERRRRTRLPSRRRRTPPARTTRRRRTEDGRTRSPQRPPPSDAPAAPTERRRADERSKAKAEANGAEADARARADETTTIEDRLYPAVSGCIRRIPRAMKYPTGDVRASHLRSASLPRRRSAMASCTHLHIFIVSSSRPTRLRRAARPPPFTFPRGTARRARRPRVARRPETSRLVREWTPSHPPTPTRRVWVVTRCGMNSATVGCTPSLASRFASTPLFRSRSNASSSSRTRRGSASSETTPATRQVTRQRTSLSSRLLRLSRCRTTSIRGASSARRVRVVLSFFFRGCRCAGRFPPNAAASTNVRRARARVVQRTEQSERLELWRRD